MTFHQLQTIILKENIPTDVRLTSDSGWECSATEMDGIYYNETENELVFTQSCSKYDRTYHESPEWRQCVPYERRF